MFTFPPGCIGIGRRLIWTLDSAQLELRMLLVPATIPGVLKWGQQVVFLSRRRFLLFCQKVRVCCPLRLSKRPHRDLASKSRCVKYAIQNFAMFSINRSYMLQIFQASTVPYSTKPARRVLHAHSSINIDPFVPAELPREAPSELAVDKFQKKFSGNLRSLLNCKPEMHLTTRQTQLLAQQTTRFVS
jgi:hypothetical protein